MKVYFVKGSKPFVGKLLGFVRREKVLVGIVLTEEGLVFREYKALHFKKLMSKDEKTGWGKALARGYVEVVGA